MDPENLPEGDLKTMNFGSGGNTKVKAWKDIWGSGQGIGPVTTVRPVAEFVAELEAQYLAARRELEAKVRLSARRCPAVRPCPLWGRKRTFLCFHSCRSTSRQPTKRRHIRRASCRARG